MKDIAHLKSFTKEELYGLLKECSESLSFAYQEIQHSGLWHIAMQARLASEALRHELDMQNHVKRVLH